MTDFSVAASGRRAASASVPSLIGPAANSSYLATRVTPATMSEVARPSTGLRRELSAERFRSIEEKLFDARALCKITTRQFAMLFDADWHKRFFIQLDQLMDAEEWDSGDEPVTRDSFTTLIRLLMVLRHKRRPGLGIANGGNIVASWSSSNTDRLTVECLPGDRVRWLVTVPLDGGRESAAGDTLLDRLLINLQPYKPQHWFDNEEPKAP